MKDIYDLLIKLNQLNNINKINKIILDNYNIFLKLTKINPTKKIKIQKNNIDDDDNNLYSIFILFHNNYLNLIKENCDRIVKYKEEIYENKSSNNYIVIATNTKDKLNIFKIYLLIYYIESKLNKLENYLGFDFEFNTNHVVALCQINFELCYTNNYKNNLICLFDPEQLDEKWKLFFIHKIICSKYCYKILHGSDSLDIKYIYYVLLQSKSTLIEKFTHTFIDSKFLCEFKYYINNKELGKCKIYSLLLNEKIITQKKLDELHINEEKMGPIYDIFIDINNLNKHLLNYSFYDVIYLYHMIMKYKHELINYDLINELTRLSYLVKRKIINYIPVDEINIMNNYFFNYNGNLIRLNQYFKEKLDELLNNDLFNYICKVNYFKKSLLILVKFIIFKKLSNNNDILKKIKLKVLYDNKILNYNNDFLDSYPNLKKLIMSII